MFKALFRLAIVFAVVWMVVPHATLLAFARPGFAAVAHHFGWVLTPANDPTAARDCAAAAAPKRPAPRPPAAQRRQAAC